MSDSADQVPKDHSPSNPKISPIILTAPPCNSLKEVFTPEIIASWKRSLPASQRLRYRLQVVEATGNDPAGMRSLRSVKAAWERYLDAAFASGMFSGEKGADLRARLTGINDDNFRSAMSECLACWFFAAKMTLPINPTAPGRGKKNLEMFIFDSNQALGIEVKAPYRPHLESGCGDDSDAIEANLEQADRQFDKDRPNILVVAPSGRLQMCTYRQPLMRALYGRSKITFLIDKATGSAVTEPKSVFVPEGKFFNNRLPGGKLLKPADGMPAYRRVSALMCIEESQMQSDPDAIFLFPRNNEERHEKERRIANNTVWIEHNAVVLHNPFAYHPIREGLFKAFPRCLPSDGRMFWTDGYSNEV